MYKEAKQLIIIGNGFDKKCGLKSGFNNYVDHQVNTTSRYNIINNIIKNNHFSSVLYGRFLQSEILNKTFDDFSIWDLLLMIQSKKNSSTMWSDIEGFISESFSRNDPNDSSKKKKSFWDNCIFAFNNRPTDPFHEWIINEKDESIVAKYILYSITSDDFRRISENQLFDYLEIELRKFEKNFSKYLREEANSNTIEYNLKKKSLMDQLIVYSTNILTFNYTDTLDDNRIKSTENVHGNLEKNNCIIGIDGSNIDFNNPSYRFTKTLRKIAQFTELKKETHKVLSPKIKLITFYGHSLNPQDYSYFQTIFDFYDIYREDVNLVFYYTLYNKETENQIRKSTYESVVRLINQYGKTFITEPHHGKNLLHKLLIESRIQIRELE